jgi:cell pole-organizing protein PopZ
MADTKTDKEPSIEEILESIRQIISEDGDAAKPAQAAPAAPAPAPAAAAPPPPPPPPPKPAAPEPILDLTDKVQPVSPSDLDLSVKPEPAMTDTGASLMSDSTASVSAASMAKLLEGNVAVEREVPGRVGNVTLEDMARDLMRPLIKTWLDQNLPGLVEKMVQKEIEKLSRRAGG